MKNNNESKGFALHYFKTLVEVARESFLILDHDLRVISGNPVFYKNFKVSKKQTENKFLYELGNGQWNIPELRKLLEEILPEKKVVKDYEVTHLFETIGKKTMLLNARQIDTVQLIVLAIEDISIRKNLEDRLAKHSEELEVKIAERTRNLDSSNQQLKASNQQLRASNQQLNASTQQVRATNQQLAAAQKVLKEKMAELEKFNKAVVGRELKMVELKKEIEILRKQVKHS